MSQAIQNTDAYILMTFGDAVLPLKGQQQTPEVLQELRKHGVQAVARLKNNGHSLADCIDLMREVWRLPKPTQH